MSVLVKGMKMPKDNYVVMTLYPSGNCYLYYQGCGVIEKTVEVIEVPKHGRLIDADMMERECCHGCKNELHKYGNCIDCALANAPTVIEREE